MTNFEPTILGIITLSLSLTQLNEGLQAGLMVITIAYTLFRIVELLDNKKNNKKKYKNNGKNTKVVSK
jgi:ABC-type proline/glycine betaine transport system permease subunit